MPDQARGEWRDGTPEDVSSWCGSQVDCATRPDPHALYRIRSVVNTNYLTRRWRVYRSRTTLPASTNCCCAGFDRYRARRLDDQAHGARLRIPWDKDETSVRYAAVFLLEEKLEGLDADTFQLNRTAEREDIPSSTPTRPRLNLVRPLQRRILSFLRGGERSI